MSNLEAYNENLSVWSKRLGVKPVGPVAEQDMFGTGRRAALMHVLHVRVGLHGKVAMDIAEAVYGDKPPVLEWPDSPLALLVVRCRKARGLNSIGRAMQRVLAEPGDTMG